MNSATFAAVQQLQHLELDSSAVPLSLGGQFSTVKIGCDDVVLQQCDWRASMYRIIASGRCSF